MNAFDAQPFSPNDWSLMSTGIFQLYRRYLDMALVTALLMQKAYNFETDQQVQFIKSDYSSNEIKGLLAADALMADVQNFSYDLITSNAGKPQPVRQTLSLASRYPYAFESQFRKTGVMESETAMEDFDFQYPGIYAGRIAAVEVEVDGLVPPSGLSGTLMNNGISTYRVPSSRLVFSSDRCHDNSTGSLHVRQWRSGAGSHHYVHCRRCADHRRSHRRGPGYDPHQQ